MRGCGGLDNILTVSSIYPDYQKVRIEVHNVHQVQAGCAACSLIPDNLPDDRYDVSVGIEEGGGIHQWCIPQNKTATVGGWLSFRRVGRLALYEYACLMPAPHLLRW